MRKILKYFNHFIHSIIPTKKEIIFMCAVFVSFSMFFVAGLFNSQTKAEQISAEISQAVSISKEAHLFCKNEKKSMISNERFSKYVNDQFYEITPFKNVIGYNLDKSVNCSIEELGDLGINPSFLTSTYFTNHENNNGDIILDRYYCGLLFKPTNTSRDGNFDNFVYITKTQADYLINQNNSFETYHDVLDSELTIVIDGQKTAKWKVANIIDDSYLFCEMSSVVFENYLLCFTLVPEALKKSESMLFSMSDSNYLNIDYISLMETYFTDTNDYFYTGLNETNNKSIVRLASFLNNKKSNTILDVFSIILFILFGSPFLALAFFIYKEQHLLLKHIFEFSFVSAFVWLLFFIVHKLSRSIVVFSFVSLALFFAIFIIFFFYMFIMWLVKKYGKRHTII